MENHVIEYSSTDLSNYTLFNQLILKYAAETATKTKSSYKGWFHFSKSTLLPATTHCDRILHTIHTVTSVDISPIKKALNAAQNVVTDTISLAKATLSSYQADRINAMKFTPKDAWKSVKILVEVKEIHHKNPFVIRMWLPNGKLATTDAENASILDPYFERFYTAHRPIT